MPHYEAGKRNIYSWTVLKVCSQQYCLVSFSDAQLTSSFHRINQCLELSWKTLIPPLPTSSTTATLMVYVSCAIVKRSQLAVFDRIYIVINLVLHMFLYINPANINSSAVVAAASLVARTLYILGSDDELNTTALSSINVNSSLVEELLGCLLTCEPGLSCGLVKDYIAPASPCPNNYVGVLLGEPTSTPYREYVSDTSRFVWNFLAQRTSLTRENMSSTCSQGCSDRDQVCIRAETTGKGTCVVSTTR